MPNQTDGLTLVRLVDVVPDWASDADAATFLQKGVKVHGLKVYVAKPFGTNAFEQGFPYGDPMGAYGMLVMTRPQERIKEHLAEAKLHGLVIDYGMAESDIEFLELDSINVSEIASTKLTTVHWFTGGALRVGKDCSATPAQGLIPVPSARRCLRPINDYNEMADRQSLGGALKYEAKFSYEFRIHDVFVDASKLDLLKFATDPPKAHDDPFGIRTSAPAVYWAYQAAKKFRPALLNETKKKEVVIQWLCTKSPQSPYQTKYVADQIFKYINPHHRRGRGTKVPPFDIETLRSFRDQYPDEKDSSDGLVLIICASMWWSKEYDRHLQDKAHRLPLHTTVDKKLQHYGFCGPQELQALCTVIMARTRDSGAQPKTKTKSEKKLKMLTRTESRKAPPG